MMPDARKRPPSRKVSPPSRPGDSGFGGRFLSFRIEFMSNPGPLYRPYDKLVKIKLGGKEFEVPAGNMLLRAMQFLSPKEVSCGRFCWNEECQYCRVNYDLGQLVIRAIQ